MHDPTLLGLIARQLSGQMTDAEKEQLHTWLARSADNKTLFNQIETTWKSRGKEQLTFRKRFNRKSITYGLLQETAASFIGIGIGIWINTTFNHTIPARRNLRNLFGLLGGKKKVVHDIPEWAQFALSVLLGFIAIELLTYFFQSKAYAPVWNFLKKATGRNS